MALISTMQRAKMEAIQNNTSIGITYSNNGYIVICDFHPLAFFYLFDFFSLVVQQFLFVELFG